VLQLHGTLELELLVVELDFNRDVAREVYCAR
jgi:hypothetical protein